MKNVNIILGDICYPKSEALIIPANTKGIMSDGVPRRIVKAGLTAISKEAREIAKKNNIKVEECFSTNPGRLNRRGVKKIYHSVIKRLQSDFTSIYIVEKALQNVFKHVIIDGMKSVALCGIGIEPGDLDVKTIAMLTIGVCRRYNNRIEIRIIDDNKEFIEELNKLTIEKVKKVKEK
jgi:O-acetyl-ADP-ribose deacetylase (regulator of RNase III)